MATLTKKKVSLVEAYKNRLALAENLYKQEHDGKSLTESKKMIIAKVLNNTNQFLTEKFEAAQGTQLASLGDWKKFCLDLTNVALPNLIAMDLVLTSPMKSSNGYVRYIKFVAGTTKGGVTEGQVFNDPFKLGTMDAARAAYTSNSVVETSTGDGTKTAFDIMWTQGAQIAKVTVAGEATDAYTYDAETGKVTFTTAPANKAEIKIAYTYNNAEIPQDKIPTLKATEDMIFLKAKPRRIAIYYSTLAQYTYKVETGADLGAMLKEQAVAEIQYEIDTEVINLLTDMAFNTYTKDDAMDGGQGVWTRGAARTDFVTFYKKPRTAISLKDHYMAFLSTIEEASRKIYDKTKKYSANYMVVSSAYRPILTMIDGFKASEIKPGPYYCGNVAGLKVYVSPTLDPEQAFVGFNGNDLATSSAVFAPFMAITPTQLIEMPDNTNMQGFASLYDLKPLNECLLVGIKLIDGKEPEEIGLVGQTQNNG